MRSFPRDEIGSRRRFAALVLTVLLSAVGLALTAAACCFWVPPVVQSRAYLAQFTVLPGFLYAGQPAKSIAFDACCIAAPFLVLLAFNLSRRWTDSLSAAALRRCIVAGLALQLLFWVACLFPVFYCPHPPLWIHPRWLLVPFQFPPPIPAWEWIVSVLAGVSMVVFFADRATTHRTRKIIIVFVLLLAALLAPTRFYAPSDITDQLPFTYHLNSVLDALSQATNGHHLLVDFPHIYGGYVELLAPVVGLFPRAISVPLPALAIPSVLGVLFYLLTAWRVIRQPGMLLLGSLGLLSFAFLVSLPDPNYGYVAARGFFPPLGLFCAARYFQRPGNGRYVLASIVAAVAPIWNLDTGLVLWGSWTLTLLAFELAAWRPARLAAHLAFQLGLFFGAWTAFFLYLRLASGAWPDLHLLFYFQSLVVKSGYFCVPLLVPDAWISLALLYLTGLAIAAIAHLRRQVGGQTQMILMLSLLGVGTFSYYMGRSAETNLVAVCSPGVLLLGVLGSEVGTLIRLQRLPADARWFLLPWIVMVFWWVFLLFVQLPVLVARGPQLVRAWRENAVTPFEAHAALVTRWVHPHEEGVYFLSNHSGLYYYLSQTTRPLQIPGTVELLRTRDMNVLLSAIQNRRLAKLVVDQNFYDIQMYRSDVYQAIAANIAAHYRPYKTSPDGQLTLYEPSGPASP